jgi:hypothetical protein
MRGHVRERGKGNWYAVLSVRDPETGKRKVKFVSLPDAKGKREAQQHPSSTNWMLASLLNRTR